MLTGIGAWQKSAVHDVVWEAIGAESDTVVYDWDYVFITVLGPEITLDMTVMVDDGHETCGTEHELAVPVGTQVRYCYTMTDSGDEDVNYHFLDDDQLGSLINHLDREVAPGETLVHTEVAVITEAVTSTGQWRALSQGTGVDVLDTDTVVVEIADEVEPTTTTSTVPCSAGTVESSVAPEPPPTLPTTVATAAVTTTTTTAPPTTTTTTTTSPATTTTLGLVLPTTPTTTIAVIVGVTFTTTLPPPEGFRRAPSATTGPGSLPDDDPSGGRTLPATA